MLQTTFQPNWLDLLHAQHRYYTGELGNTHRLLARQYSKLAQFELELLERHERELTRQDKKRLQWSRSNAKSAIKKLESQQAWLRNYLSQCSSFIAVHDQSAYTTPVTPWSPPSSYTTTSFSLGPSQWPVETPTTPPSHHQQAPQYWDLSTFGGRRESSSYAPSASVDSGFYEPHTFVAPLATPENDEQNPAHDFIDPFAESGDDDRIVTAPRSRSSVSSERIDEVPELLSSAQVGNSESPRNRRYSEDAIRLIESRLNVTRSHRRGNSAGAVPVLHRTLSVC